VLLSGKKSPHAIQQAEQALRRRQMSQEMNGKAYTGDYECIHCEGIADIRIIKDSEKGTYPSIEVCPFCGMSNSILGEAIQ